MAKVFWAVLLERAVQEYGVNSLLNVAMQCGAQDYLRLILPYMRTDTARNMLVSSFLENSDDPNDVLVMLDCDHIHPQNVVVKLANHPPENGVVGALYFRRSVPHDPLMFLRCDDGKIHNIVRWPENSIVPCDIVATGAIAIKRWVFDKLKEHGIQPPYFRYEYVDGKESYSTEDVYFGELCEKAGISHYCDTSIVLPHLTAATVDQESWNVYQKDNPDLIIEVT